MECYVDLNTRGLLRYSQTQELGVNEGSGNELNIERPPSKKAIHSHTLSLIRKIPLMGLKTNLIKGDHVYLVKNQWFVCKLTGLRNDKRASR